MRPQETVTSILKIENAAKEFLSLLIKNGQTDAALAFSCFMYVYYSPDTGEAVRGMCAVLQELADGNEWPEVIGEDSK